MMDNLTDFFSRFKMYKILDIYNTNSDCKYKKTLFIKKKNCLIEKIDNSGTGLNDL